MNIVFDLGGVVFNWLPDVLVKSVYADPKTQALALSEIIRHPDWIELDRGTITQQRAIAEAASRTGLPVEEVSRLFERLPPSLTPNQATIDLLHNLHGQANHDLFVLSNMHHASIGYLEEHFDIWKLFRATVISCRVAKVKPEPDIFDYLLTAHDLSAQETVFIDDMKDNVQAALALGMKAIWFQNAGQCRRELRALGYCP